MTLAHSFLPQFDHEMAGTRRTLERVPDDKLAWRPHAKSQTLGELSTHLAQIPFWIGPITKKDSFDAVVDGAPSHRELLATQAARLAAFDGHVTEGRAVITSMPDERMLAAWTLLAGGRTLFTMPRIACLRSFVLSHTIHHRAQLGVYLRMLDVPVPSLYGPSADEQ